MHTHTRKNTDAYSQRSTLCLLQDYLAFIWVDMKNRWWGLLQLHNQTFFNVYMILMQKEKKSGLLKLLAGASTKKKSRSPPSMSPTHDPLAIVEGMLQGAMGPELSSLSSHGRAGSCPIESEMQGAMEMEPLHRKTGSLDLNFSIPSPIRQLPPSMATSHPEAKPLNRER